MKSTSFDSYITEAQNVACTIEALSELLYSKIDEHCDHDMGIKEQMLALSDSIRLLASKINLDGVNV